MTTVHFASADNQQLRHERLLDLTVDRVPYWGGPFVAAVPKLEVV